MTTTYSNYCGRYNAFSLDPDKINALQGSYLTQYVSP